MEFRSVPAVVRKFQSTLPARGATVRLVERIKALAISIHAPRTGSDRSTTSTTIQHLNFNPRSPHGERLARNVHR